MSPKFELTSSRYSYGINCIVEIRLNVECMHVIDKEYMIIMYYRSTLDDLRKIEFICSIPLSNISP